MTRLTSRRSEADLSAIMGAALFAVALWLIAAAAWITHVAVCIKASTWALLALGCVVPPIGVIHGVGVWLGVF